MMSKVEVMDLTVVCRSFPVSPHPEIHREHFLDTIDKIFEGDTLLVVVEGVDGIGKTTFLAQYAKRHPNHALSLFIKPTSRLAYDPEYLRLDLCEQLHWLLYKKALDVETVDESYLRTQLVKLQRRARNRETYYFIIDGLHDLPEKDSRIQDIILKDMLPLGLPSFRFLISGDQKHFSNCIHKSIVSKTFPLSALSLDEAETYLKELSLKRREFEAVHRMCGGVPGHLEIVRRMLKSGINVQSLLEEEPDKLPEFVALEWSKTETANNSQKKMLAIIAYGRKGYSMADIARILDLKRTTVEDFLGHLGIVNIDSKKIEVSFVSEAHRKYAAKQLTDFKEEITNLLIDDLLKDSNSPAALECLPDYYEQSGRFDELISYLTPAYFANVLQSSQSLNPVCRKAEQGLMAARMLNRNENLMQFSMQKSVIIEMDGADIWRSEMEARMALKDYESALALAQSAILKEDRLHLLSIIARMKHEQKLLPEQELMEQIVSLYEQIDQEALGERAVEIGSNLICCDPDLAISMVETSTHTTEDNKDALDLAFTKLTIAALHANRGQSRVTNAVEKTRSRIKNPKLQRFSATASLFFGDYTAAEVIVHVDKLEIKNRLFFLRHWTIANQEREDAAEVVDYSLDLLIKNTPYTPKTRDLREIATPLPSVSDKHKARQLVGRFDSQKGSIEKLGTTEDYVRLQLLLAQTESKYDFTSAHNRILEIYWYINELTDLAIKTDCMAWMVASLDDIDPQRILESKEGLQTLTHEELRSYMEQLLDVTADHYHVARGVINAIAKANLQMTLELANSLNTQDRRDLSLLDLVTAAIEVPANKMDLGLIQMAINTIVESDKKDEARLEVIRRLSKVAETLEPSFVANALPLINSIKDIKDAGKRCIACCFAYSMLAKVDAGQCPGMISDLSRKLDAAWQSIDVGWEKVDIGFKISRNLAESSPEMANRYLDIASKVRDEIIMDAKAPAAAYLTCLRLAIRAYSGLLPGNINTNEDMMRLKTLIERIPSNGERAGLWADLALYCFINKHVDECKRIVAEHVKPLIQDISHSDEWYKNQVLIETAPALYCAHTVTTKEMISVLPPSLRDEAYNKICDFLFCKQLPSDPYDTFSGNGYLLNFTEAVDICELLKLMNTDHLIFSIIAQLGDSLVSRRNREKLTNQQKADIANRLEKVILDQLPDIKNIKHDGYKIAAQAYVARIRQENPLVWVKLIDEAREIPNISDRSLVLCIIATCLSSKQIARREKITEEAKTLIRSIPADLERIKRYAALAEMIVSVDPAMSRKCLKEATDFSLKASDSELNYHMQRRIIDLAYKLDPNYAATLASIIDDDPARSKINSDLKRRIQLLDIKKQMVDQTLLNVNPTISKDYYPRAAWMNLGALNAGRVKALHFKFVRQYIELAAEYAIHDAYPILAWVIENTIRRVGHTAEARTYLIPMFEATLLGAELAGRIASRSLAQLKQVKANMVKSSGPSKNIIIKAGERERAIKIIKDWFSQEVRDYLKICDPFFGIDDLEVLQMLHSADSCCKVHVLTSKKHQDHNKLQPPWDEAFRTHWHVHISDQDPPDTEVTIVGTKSSGDLPIHDRWLLTNGGGIRLGTSFNSLGINKSSEITVLSPEEAELLEKEVNQYLYREKIEHNGEKLLYTLFTL